MLRFNDYLKKKLEDKDFCKAYQDNCNLCQTVWKLVDNVMESGASWRDISKETGLEESDLVDFANGDNCQPQIIKALCDRFNIKPPQGCPRYNF